MADTQGFRQGEGPGPEQPQAAMQGPAYAPGPNGYQQGGYGQGGYGHSGFAQGAYAPPPGYGGAPSGMYGPHASAHGPGPYAPAHGYAQPSGAAAWFNFRDERFVKGLLVGAAATFLLTNESVQKGAIKSLVRVWTLVQGGVEEAKERFRDAEAELQAEHTQD